MTTDLNLEAAFLADFASVSNGLLQVVNGGVNQLWRGDFPSPMDVFLVCLVGMTREFKGGAAQLALAVRSTENDDVYVRGRLSMLSPERTADANRGVVPVVVDLRDVALPRIGRFAVTVSLAETEKVVDFEVLPPPTPLIPGGLSSALEAADYRRALDLIEDPARRESVIEDAGEAGRLKELVYAVVDEYASIFDQLQVGRLDDRVTVVGSNWRPAVSEVVGQRVFASHEEMQRYAESDEAKNDDKRSVGIVALNRGLNDELVDETLTYVINRGRFDSFMSALINLGDTLMPELATSDKPRILATLAARLNLPT